MKEWLRIRLQLTLLTMGYVLQPNVHIEISSPQESALLRVSNNILRAVDRHEDVLVVLLDLSAPLKPMIMTFCHMDSTLVLDFVDLFFTG